MARIGVKTPAELSKMREAGRIVAAALRLVRQEAVPSVTTAKLDAMVEELILSLGGTPAFKGYRGYPASICTSINEQVVHGIPGPVELKEGDLLSVDAGVFYKGYAADAAVTLEIGECDAEARRLHRVAEEALKAALAAVRSGVRVSEISRAIQDTAERAGFGVVRKYTGHGIGRALHEEPQVPNYVGVGPSADGPALPRGATIAIEPMVTEGTYHVRELSDGWTVVTRDGKRCAHVEHTVAVEDHGPLILTAP